MFARLRSRRDQHAKLAALSRSLATIEFALDGTILDANAELPRRRWATRWTEIAVATTVCSSSRRERESEAYRQFWERLRRGKYQTAEYKRIAKGGREVWIQASYNPVLDRAGRPIKIVKFATDITAHKLRALDLDGQIAALHRSQAVIAFALDGTILSANQNFLDAVGYRLDEIVGRHHGCSSPTRNGPARPIAPSGQRWRTANSSPAEYRRIGKGGREVWIQATYNPITDASGRPVKVVKFATDITAQVRERQRRAEAQQAIGADLDAIGRAVEDVTRQTRDGGRHGRSRLRRIQAVASGAEQLSISVDEISQQVSHAASMAGQAVIRRSRPEHRRRLQRSGHADRRRGRADRRHRRADEPAGAQRDHRGGARGRGGARLRGGRLRGQGSGRADGSRDGPDPRADRAAQSATREAVGAIDTIQGTIRTLSDVSSTIAAAVEEQSAVTREMSGSMQTVSQGSRPSRPAWTRSPRRANRSTMPPARCARLRTPSPERV